MVDTYQIMGIAGALIFSAFFSGIETAFLSADRLSMELEKERNTLLGRIMTGFLKRPDRFISTTLIGNTIALVIYSTSMAKLLDPLLQAHLPVALNNSVALLIFQTLLATLGILIVAEFIPKSIFILSPNRLLSLLALPTVLITYLLRPLVIVTTAIARAFITHVLGQQYQEAQPAFGLTDLHTFIKNTLNINDKVPASVSARMVGRLIEFRQVKVRDCMTPRAELVAVGIGDGMEALRQAVIKSEHTKILVYRNDIDDIIGYCHAKALFKKPQHIESILIPILIISETNFASEAMVRLATEGRSLALVVDEFGGTSGIVSIEDIIEKIIGEIHNEYDPIALTEQRLSQHTYLLSARHEIDYLQEKYGWELPQGDYDTLGGLIISITERIPELNETVESPPFTFTIVALEDTRIDTVKLTLKEQPIEEP
ncbi:MAG: hemolysin family protein [Bacteroidota bacterium]